MKALAFLFVVVVFGVVAAGCGPQGFCSKKQECDNHLNDDDQNVCVAAQSANINALRANHEQECQQLADAILNLMACDASLSCGDFEKDFAHPADDFGGNCQDQQAKFVDARDNAGDLCSVAH
jgi:hypothetical protein